MGPGRESERCLPALISYVAICYPPPKEIILHTLTPPAPSHVHLPQRALTRKHPTTMHHTKLHHTTTHHTTPHHTAPHRTAPHKTAPHHASPHITITHKSTPLHTHHTTPHHIMPHLTNTTPHFTKPHSTTPSHTHQPEHIVISFFFLPLPPGPPRPRDI